MLGKMKERFEMTIDRLANEVSLQIIIAGRFIPIIGAGAAGSTGSTAN